MKILREIYTNKCEFLVKNNTDWIDIGCGDERAGKTTLSIVKCRLANPAFCIDDITLGLPEFMARLDTAPRGSAICCDEGGDAFLSRLALSKSQVKALQQFMKIGEKNYFISINISDLSLLERYLKNHRLRCLTKVKTQYKYGVLTRGVCEIFTKRQAKRIYKDTSGNIKFPQPVGIDTFPMIPRDDPLWIAYKQKKDAYLKIQEKDREKKQDHPIVKYFKGYTEVLKSEVLARITKDYSTNHAYRLLRDAITNRVVVEAQRGKLTYLTLLT
jgi:hypothetical protein